jgi:hypothetical protein
MTFTDYVYLGIASMVVVFYNIFKKMSEGVKIKVATVLTESLLQLILGLLIVPYAMIHWTLPIEAGVALTAIIGLFSKVIMVASETKIKEKIEKL